MARSPPKEGKGRNVKSGSRPLGQERGVVQCRSMRHLSHPPLRRLPVPVVVVVAEREEKKNLEGNGKEKETRRDTLIISSYRLHASWQPPSLRLLKPMTLNCHVIICPLTIHHKFIDVLAREGGKARKSERADAMHIPASFRILVVRFLRTCKSSLFDDAMHVVRTTWNLV